MTLAEIITRLQDVYGNTLSSSDAYYTRVVNDAYFKICAMSEWWWLESDRIILANAPATSIVASATLGSVAMHLSAAVPTTYGLNTWIEAPGRMYRVVTVSGVADMTFTLDTPWVEATSTELPVNIWGDTFVLSTSFDNPVSLVPRHHTSYKPLVQVMLSDIEAFGINIFDHATEVADRYCIYANPDDTGPSKTYLLRIFPPPSEVTEYLFRYRMCPATLSAATDIPYLPERYHHVLVDMAKVELFKNEGEDADRIQLAEEEAMKGMSMIMRQNSQRGQINRRAGRRGLMAATGVQRVTFLNTESGV